MLKWTEIEKDLSLLVNISTLVFLKKKSVSFLNILPSKFLQICLLLRASNSNLVSLNSFIMEKKVISP